MAVILLVMGLLIAAGIIYAVSRGGGKNGVLRGVGAAVALLVLAGFFTLGSIRYVSPDEVGIVVKNAMGPSLAEGRVIAVEGEMGVQADVLRSGWHWWYWPVLYDVRTVPMTEVKPGEVGLIEAKDGRPLPPGQVIAAEFPRETFQQMLDARHFLTAGSGQKGTQASVLTPGKYALNTELFRVRTVPQTDVKAGTVGVLKANYGAEPSVVVADPSAAPGGSGDADGGDAGAAVVRLARDGEMGVRAEPLPPGKYPINPEALSVTVISTKDTIVQYTTHGAEQGERGRHDAVEQTAAEFSMGMGEEREITVRTSDGFTFPVDVRVEFKIEPRNAPLVVARLGDDGESLRNKLNSAVRAIFRNNAEDVKALDYVQQRSHQESQSVGLLAAEMRGVGVTITAVRIGNVGDGRSLGELLKTQTDREIALQEQITFQEQRRAAEQKKELTRTTQEAEEEKRLATASYGVKIAEQSKEQRIIEAGAEAEAIRIKAEAQAKAYESIAAQIGQRNAALIELLKIVGERGIQITPRVMVMGGGGGGINGVGGHDPNTTALIGTMLDSMLAREEGAAGPGQATITPTGAAGGK